MSRFKISTDQKADTDVYITDRQQAITPLSESGQKLIVTDYTLAHWLAQTHGVDMHDWPAKKPDHLSKEQFDNLRKILKDFTMKGSDRTQ